MANYKKAYWNDMQLVEAEDLETDQFYHNRKIELAIRELYGNGVIPTSISTFDDISTDTGNLAIQEDLTMEKQVTGTSISDVSYLIDDTTINLFQNVIVQKFMATSDNIFEVDVYIKQNGSWTSVDDLNIEIRELEDGTNIDSNPKKLSLGRAVVTYSEVTTSYAWITASFRDQDQLCNPGSLTVGKFYALAIERARIDSNGTVTVGITETTTDPVSGYLARYTYSTDTWANTIDTTVQYLIYRIRTNALKVRKGLAYQDGERIEVTEDVENISLADQSITGKTDYNIIALSSTWITSATQYNDRMREYVVTRTQPSYQISVFDETDWTTEQSRCRFYVDGTCTENNICKTNNWQITGKCLYGTYTAGESFGYKYLKLATAKNTGITNAPFVGSHDLENGITIVDKRPILPFAYTDETDTVENDANYVIKGIVDSTPGLYKIDVDDTGTSIIATKISS